MRCHKSLGAAVNLSRAYVTIGSTGLFRARVRAYKLVKRLLVGGAIAVALSGSVSIQTGGARAAATTTRLYLGTKRVSVLYPNGPHVFEVPVSSGVGDTTWVSVGRGI